MVFQIIFFSFWRKLIRQRHVQSGVSYCLDEGFSTFHRPRAKFSQFSGRKIVNEKNLVKTRGNLLTLAYYCKQVQTLLKKIPYQKHSIFDTSTARGSEVTAVPMCLSNCSSVHSCSQRQLLQKNLKKLTIRFYLVWGKYLSSHKFTH